MSGTPWYRRSFNIFKTFKKAYPPDPPFWVTDSLRSLYLSPGTADQEKIENDFECYVTHAYKANGIVFACMLARQLVFSEARFQWREFRKGRPGNLFGSDELALLENPWPGGTTGELLARMEQDASLAGNCYLTTADDRGRVGRSATGPGRRIVRLRPDWVTLVLESASENYYDADARVVGLIYEPRLGTPRTKTILVSGEFSHYSPIPDPTARFRGMSWLTPIINEITADKAATRHKLKFFEKGATPQIIIKFDKDTGDEAYDEFVEKFKASHEGVDNAYKTLALTPGADVMVVGKDLHQLDFKNTQGAGETRIAAAARVHPAIVGLSEGMQGSSLNAGNYGAAKRMFVDGTLRPLWRMASASLQTLVTPPREGVSLWYDDRDIAFLREDAKDLAEIQNVQATTITMLKREGFTGQSSVAAVMANDYSLLVDTGLISVQLLPPGTVAPDSEPNDPGQGV